MTDGASNASRVSRQMEIATELLRETITANAIRIPADATLARLFRQHPEFGSRDRRHYSHIVFSYFRWFGWIKRIATEDLDRQVAWALALEKDGQDDELVTRWIDHLALPAEIRVVLATADISAKSAQLNELFPDLRLRIDHLVPDWLPEALGRPDQLETFIASCQRRPPTWVSIDPARVKDFCIMLDAQRIAYQADVRLPGAIRIDSPFQRQILERAWGWSIQIQDIGSQAVIAACGAEPGASWWDACSGAGGKALALSRLVGPQGAVLATDVRESILVNLRQRVEAARATNVQTMVLDCLGGTPNGRIFDGVLVDAPCSGLGTWSRNPDARWRMSAEDIAARAITQRQLLHNVAARVKPGGLLVYSLCTLTASESRDVVEHFIAEHSSFQLEPFIDPLNGQQAPGERWLQPDEGPGDGMYFARLRRIA